MIFTQTSQAMLVAFYDLFDKISLYDKVT